MSKHVVLPGSFLAACVLLFVGCGTVRPEGEYRRAGSLIQLRTGSELVYDPGSEVAIEEQVQRLMEGGLSAEESVEVALLNDKAFQSQFIEIGVSKADFVQSALLTNPTLSISARFSEGGGRANLGFGIAQEIAELWQLPVRKRIAKDQLERTILQVTGSAIDLASRTKQAYFKLRVLEELGNVIRDEVALLQYTEQLAQNRFDAGEASKLDVNLVCSDLFEARMRLESTRGDERMARAEFERLLGLSADQAGVKLIDSLSLARENLEADETLIRNALATRVDVRMAAADLDGAEAEIKRQRRAVIPMVTVGIDGERPDARAPRSLKPLPPAPPKADFSGMAASQSLNSAITQLAQARRVQGQELGATAKDLMLQQVDAWRDRQLEKRQIIDLLLGPSVQITLPVWDQNRAQISKAEYQFAQKQKNYAEIVLGIVQEVRQTSATLESTSELLRISNEEALPLAEQNMGTAERLYEAGEESILALLLAQQSYNAQREAHFKLLGDYAIALADLERAVGGRSGEITGETAVSAVSGERP